MFNIGRVLVYESNEQDSGLFDEILEIVKKHSASEYVHIENDTVLQLTGLKIDYAHRKAYCNQHELTLTQKEFNLLYLLAVNRGQVLSYDQIYRKVWHEDSFGNINNNIAYHICKLRKKINKHLPQEIISIKCIHKFGYSLEINT